ncbi:hypothetical protein KIH74_04560 [Kineosporia sp. J2-2]|uniref:PH domain-containing protein n=1 Tax=Kineosporia corallincola TaxID=2835133 RepID=A0ABS5TAU1_9ACTN|nr:hypothetical protein [Kineosporia corallincola]MBT0768181.1 hypothetical protein [Kineosporia corallincola]
MLRFRATSWWVLIPVVLSLTDPSVDAFIGTATAAALISALRTRFSGEDVSPEGIRMRRLLLPTRVIPADDIVRVYSEPGFFGFVRAELTTGRPPALFSVPADRVDDVNALLRAPAS